MKYDRNNLFYKSRITTYPYINSYFNHQIASLMDEDLKFGGCVATVFKTAKGQTKSLVIGTPAVSLFNSSVFNHIMDFVNHFQSMGNKRTLQ